MLRTELVRTFLLAMALSAPAGVVSAPAAMAADPVVTPAEVSSDEVSFDGRYLWDADTFQVVDQLTGTRSAVPACSGDRCWAAGFVRDNPSLVLQFEYGPRPIAGEAGDRPSNRPPLTGVYLVDTVSGARQRVDTDSSGAPLVPAWRNAGTCGNEWCDNFSDFPDVFVAPQSVSRNGLKVAFCTNYTRPAVANLYVKDLSTGRLTQTALRCPVLDAMGGESTFTRPPEISANGRVVHVNGDVVGTGDPDLRWTADTLFFTRTGRARRVAGWGSMTRDGGTVFMRLGVPKRATRPSRIHVGAYRVATRKVVRLAGRDELYGTKLGAFAAYEQSSHRGRFVAGMQPVLSEGSGGALIDVRVWVIDRSSGVRSDLGPILRAQGYQASDDRRPIISGDGTTVLVRAQTADPELTQSLVVTGWQATARAAVRADRTGSKLLVDVDPDKGSGYWTFRVQARRADGSWRTLEPTYRTQGRAETRTIDLPAGTYRVVVKPRYGYQGSTSSTVALIR